MNFRPPLVDGRFVSCVNRLTPALLRWTRQIESVDVSPDDIRRMQMLDGKRLLIACNHPTCDDPAIAYALAAQAGIPCHYLACRENFDAAKGLAGWVLQRLGGYSVVRGTPDRESFRMTRRLLAAPGGRVVIFPEGEVYSQNDSLLPFQAGVVQLAFWALDDVRAAGDATGSIAILPVAVRYTFIEDMRPAIDRALTRLEQRVFPEEKQDEAGSAGAPDSADATASQYARLRRIGIEVLSSMEREYGVKVARKGAPADSVSEPIEDLSDRMDSMKRLLLDRVASMVEASAPADMTLPERMRFLINKVHNVVREDPESERTPYQALLHSQQVSRVTPMLQDLERVANWVAVQDNYVGASPTPERMADNIRRLEIEVFGCQMLTGRRRATVRVGAPIDLSDYYEAYKKDKRGVVANCVSLLEHAVQSLLDEHGETI